MKPEIIYIAGINIITFLVFAIDKQKACTGKYRIRERTLLILSIIGGAFGGLLAMYLFRHKIRKKSFAAGLPLIFIVQIIVLFYLEIM